MSRKNKDEAKDDRQTRPGVARHDKPSTPGASPGGAGNTGVPSGGGKRGAAASDTHGGDPAGGDRPERGTPR